MKEQKEPKRCLVCDSEDTEEKYCDGYIWYYCNSCKCQFDEEPTITHEKRKPPKRIAYYSN